MGTEELLLNISYEKPRDDFTNKKKPFTGKKRKITVVQPQIPVKKNVSEYDAAIYDKPLSKRNDDKAVPGKALTKKEDTGNFKPSGDGVHKNFAKKARTERKGDIASLVKEASRDSSVRKIENEDISTDGNSLFSGSSFSESPLHPYLVDNIKKAWNIEEMTEVQSKTIGPLIEGKDALVHWQTGSGKTLAYALPLIHRLGAEQPKLTRADGIRAVIILPTRELALQTYQAMLTLVKSFAWLVVGCVVGGERRKAEKARLRKGITVIIGTPTRLLDHASSTSAMHLGRVSTVILDEADRLVDLGYQQHVSKLLDIMESSRAIDGKRQTVLLSATLSPGVERLAGLALSDPVRIADASDSPAVLPSTLTQRVVVAPIRLRLVTLASLIVKHLKEDKCHKLMVFAATQDMVECLEHLLALAGMPARLFKLHGSMSQIDRTHVFAAFKKVQSGVLIATDVAGRGLDVPAVGAVIQFTGPFDIADYIHRVGRTARTGRSGRATLVLAPGERPFLDILAERNIKIQEEDLGQVLESIYHLDFGETKPKDLEDAATLMQLKLEKSVEEDKELHSLCAKGFTSFVRFYATYPRDLRSAFDKRNLHLGHYAKSFALRDTPSNLVPSLPARVSIDKHKEKRGPMKPLSEVSEYASGLDDIVKKKKKKKS